MKFEYIFNLCDNPQDVTWIIQDNSSNTREVYKGVDYCPAEYLIVTHYKVYQEDGETCIYVGCVRDW